MKQQDGRLPPAYSPASNFVEDAFRKDKTVLFSEIL